MLVNNGKAGILGKEFTLSGILNTDKSCPLPLDQIWTIENLQIQYTF